MGNMRGYERGRFADLTDVRGKLVGAALVAFGVIAFSAYSFAIDGGQPSPIVTGQVSSGEVRTTPDNTGRHEMPPPVAPAKHS